MKAFKYCIPVVALLLAGCGGGAGSNVTPSSGLVANSGASQAVVGGARTTAAKTNTNGNGLGNGCGNGGNDNGKGNGGTDNGNGNGNCSASPSPVPSPSPFTSGVLNFSQDCTASFAVVAGGVINETNRHTTGLNTVTCPELDHNIEFLPGSGQTCASSVSNWGPLVTFENWTVALNPGPAPLGDDALQVLFPANATYTACHYQTAPPPPPAAPTVTTTWTGLGWSPAGCTANFALYSNGEIVETNRTVACGLSTDWAKFLPAGAGSCTADLVEPSGTYDASLDPTLQTANGGPFAPGSYSYCFYPNTTPVTV